MHMRTSISCTCWHAAKDFNPPSHLSRMGIRCLALFVCVCVRWSVCVGCGGGAGFLSPLSVLSWLVCYTRVRRQVVHI